jgi:hypothetical protein
MRVTYSFVSFLSLLLFAGCVRTSVMPFSADTFQITTSAAPVCGGVGAQRIATEDAAIATIQNGFDSLIILGAQARDNVG